MVHSVKHYLILFMAYTMYGASSSSLTPPDVMESPYKHLGLNYKQLHGMRDEAIKKIHTQKNTWNNAPICSCGEYSIMRGWATFCLRIGEIVAPCAIWYMASNECTGSACILGTICGLRKVCCVKKCCNKVVKLTPFEYTQKAQQMISRIRDINAAMDARPQAERVAFIRQLLKASPARFAPPSPKEKID